MIILKPFRIPYSGTHTFGIRDIYIKQAIKNKTSILAEYKGIKYVIDPVKWRRGEVIFRKYLYPDRPMALYVGNLLDYPKEQSFIEQWQNE